MRAFLGFGTNLGNRKENLLRAFDLLTAPDLMPTQVSGVYETEPVGLREQPLFLNLVAEFETTLPVLDLLHRCQNVEIQLGRERSILNGPRTIDIDVLLFGDLVISSEELTLPHPRYRDRRFTLAPLAEIAPDLTDPVTGQTMASMLAVLLDQPVRRLGELADLSTI